MANRLMNRKKSAHNENALETVETMTNNDVRISIIGFNYDELNLLDSDKEQLISYEKELLFQGKQLGNIAFIVGENLYKAKQILKKYSDRDSEIDPTSFVSWYTKLGLSKDQVYLFLGRYNLALNFPEYKERIISLSDRTIKETINKNTPSILQKKVLEGKLSTGKEIKEARESLSNEISSTLEILEEAQIVESEEERTKRIKKEIRLLRQEANELIEKAKYLKEQADELEKTL